MKKIYLLLGSIAIAGASIAQANYMVETYDFAPNEKYSPGAITVTHQRTSQTNQDRAVYFTEDFDGGLNGWVGDIQTGTAGFGLTNSGHVNNATNTFQIPALATSTPTQWVMLDSDADGTAYSNPEDATFNSPMIDLSGTSGQFVALQFDQFMAEWEDPDDLTNDHCFIAVSTDSALWTEIEVNEFVGRNARPNPEMISWDITDAIAGNLGTVWIRFRWEGAWNYGWQIDNISIADIPEKDLELVNTWRALSPLNQISYSKVPQAHATEFVIGAIIKNSGHDNQSNVSFDYEIKNSANSVVSSGSATDVVTLTSAVYDTILFETGFTPTDLGNYSVKIWPTSTEGDDFADNDTIVDSFYELTEFTYARDFAEGSVEGCTEWPLSNGDQAWYGNLFDFTGDDVISAIEFKLADNASNVGETVIAEIFVFLDGGTEWISFWDSDDYTVLQEDLGTMVTIPTGGFDVNANDLYMVTVGQYAATTDPIFEKQGDIKLNNIQGRGNNNGTIGMTGFFDRLAPIVRARLNEDELGIDDEIAEDRFSIFPNPANEAIKVSISLTNSENTVINVLDISGKTIRTMNLGNVNGDKNLSISLDGMNTGIYFVEMVNEDGTQVKKFVKN